MFTKLKFEAKKIQFYNIMSIFFIILNFMGQVYFDRFEDGLIHHKITVLFLLGAVLLFIPAIKKISFTPVFILLYWSSSNFILTYLWGVGFGFRFQIIAAIILNIMYIFYCRIKLLNYIFVYQVFAFFLLEIYSHQFLTVGADIKVSDLFRFNYLFSTFYAFILLFDMSRSVYFSEEVSKNQSNFYEKILNHIPSLIGYWDVNLINLFSNTAYKEYFGIKASDVVGKQMQEILGSEIYNSNLPYINGALKGELQTFEREIPAANGLGFRHTITNYIPHLRKNKVVGFFVYITDVSELKKREIDLERTTKLLKINQVIDLCMLENNNFESLFERFFNSIIQLESNWSLLFYWQLNPSGEHFTLMKVETKFQNKYSDFIKISSKRNLQVTECLPGRVFQSQVVECISDISSDTHFARRAYALTNNINSGLAFPVFLDGKVHGVIEAFGEKKNHNSQFMKEDLLAIGIRLGQAIEGINNRKELNIEKVKTLQLSKLASMGEMLTWISHEINNPLSIMLNSIEMLPQIINNPEKLQSKLDAINRGGERISKIIYGIKKIAKSSDSVDYKISDLNAIIKESISLTELRAKRNQTLIKFECKVESPLIFCNELEIHQVLINLINNSITAIKLNIEKWIHLILFEDKGQIVLRVIDSGCGIPEAIRRKLFQPLFASKVGSEGAGIGLSIIKGILDEHKATIEIIHELENTCFEIRFQKAEQIK